MAKKSAASREVSTLAAKIADVQIMERPDAPYELTEAEANIWRAIIMDVAADFITPKNYALLTQLCRHIARSHHLARVIALVETDIERKLAGQATINDFDVSYPELLKQQRAESQVIASLSTKMRLSQQSMVDPESRKLKRKSSSNLFDRPIHE